MSLKRKDLPCQNGKFCSFCTYIFLKFFRSSRPRVTSRGLVGHFWTFGPWATGWEPLPLGPSMKYVTPQRGRGSEKV